MEGTGPQLRALRAALFAALCVTLSATSHVLLSRMPLPLTTVAAAYALVFTAAYALGGRERGYWAVAALLVPLELAADTAFTAGQHTCYGPGGGPVTGSWRALTCDGGAIGGTLAHSAGTGAGTGLAASASPWLLLAVHLVVGLAASWCLRRGEAALHRVLRTAFRPLAVAMAALRTAPYERPAARHAHAAVAAPVPALPLLAHSVVRRGPPITV